MSGAKNPSQPQRTTPKKRSAASGTVWIGTSGWMYRHWANDVFYPRDVKQIDWLSYFAQHFRTVELNASFYRLPQPQAVTRWKTVAPAGFVFAVKCWRRITHLRRLNRQCADDLRLFLERMQPLGAHLGPILVQIPPSMHADLELLRGFLEMVPRRLGRKALRVALEVRHESWLRPETMRLLDEFGVSLVMADWPGCDVRETNEAPFVYIRRHGPGKRYESCYSEEHLQADAERIGRFAQQGRDVYVYFNNDVAGHAVRNAARLIELVNPQTAPRGPEG